MSHTNEETQSVEELERDFRERWISGAWDTDIPHTLLTTLLTQVRTAERARVKEQISEDLTNCRLALEAEYNQGQALQAELDKSRDELSALQERLRELCIKSIVAQNEKDIRSHASGLQPFEWCYVEPTAIIAEWERAAKEQS